jgi:hypothetical protein
MFNAKKFEQKIYEIVTKEVNTVFSKILIGDKRAVQKEGIKIQQQFMKILHSVTEETATQILYGLLIHSKND